MNKKDVVHIYDGILLSHKRNNAIWSNTDGPRGYHTKSEAERQISYNITYTQNLKYDTNELTYKTGNGLTDIENRLWLPRGRGMGRIGLCVWD